jgi:superfamily II DNA/RNA helicase
MTCSVGICLLVHSETGSGKTAAFSLPILNNLFKDPRGIFALVIVPTREIAIQISEAIEFYGSSNTVRIATLVGGMDYNTQKKELENAPHIVVGTPGRLAEQLQKSEKGRKYLRNLEYLVLDEADKLLDESLFFFIKQILELLPSKPIQKIFSTATVELSDVDRLQELTEKKIVKLSTHRAIEKAKSVSLKYLLMPDHVKDCYFTHLLRVNEDRDIIVFINSCE